MINATNEYEAINQYISQFLANLEKTGQIIDEKYIKKMLDNWPIKNFSLNEQGIVTNDFAIDKLGKTIEKLVNLLPINQFYLMNKLQKRQLETVNTNEICKRSLFIYQICNAILKHCAKKSNNERMVDNTFCMLTNTGLSNFYGSLTSFLSGDYITVLQKIRCIYECLVTIFFIANHKETIKPFLDYINLIQEKIYKNLSGFNNYEWAGSIFPEEKNITLSLLANDVGIQDEMNELYKLSSNFIHINAYSSIMTSQLNQHNMTQYLTITSTMVIKITKCYIKTVGLPDHQYTLLNLILQRLNDICFPMLIPEKKKE